MPMRLFTFSMLGTVVLLVTTAFLGQPGIAVDGQSAWLQEEIDAASRAGGGEVRLPPGSRITIAKGIILREGVTLDLNGGEIVAVLREANSAGVRVMSNTTLRNGKISVVSRGQPGSQAGAHAPVLVGALLGENAAPDKVSPFAAPRNWRLGNLTLSSDKAVMQNGISLGAPAIQVMGDANNGLIEQIFVPDSDRMAGGVFLDWGIVGAISSSNIRASSKTFEAGRGYTTHPHDIEIRNIRIGRLTRPSIRESGSFGVRISGTQDISINDVSADRLTEAGFYHTVGDVGFAFALPWQRARGAKGNSLSNLNVEIAGAYLVRSDSFADNVGRAVSSGYRPRQSPFWDSDLSVSNVTGTWSGRELPGFGLRLDHQRGGTFADIDVSRFHSGIVVDEQVYDVNIIRPIVRESRSSGITIGHPHRPPARIAVLQPRAIGDAASARTLRLGASEDITLSGFGKMLIDRSGKALRSKLIR